jgi:RNA polymerase sigma factor (sigma-70 family)
MLDRSSQILPLREHARECALAFRWQHCRDVAALHVLMQDFQPLVYGMAAEMFRRSQLDKGVKVVKARTAANNPELAGHFDELMQQGQRGLLDAATRYDGRCRFSTYARHWLFKRMQDYVRWSWNIVVMPEPAEWKVAKEDQIPKTHPNPKLNPFENPYSNDKTAKHSRSVGLFYPVEDDNRQHEEIAVGRYGGGTSDSENSIFGVAHFEPGDYQSRAHEGMEAEDRAIEFETLSLTLDARQQALTRRKLKIVRARFPWAVDVLNAPHREKELGEYLPGHQICFPRKHGRWTIGAVLAISDEWVKRIEERAISEMRRSKLIAVCSGSLFWGKQPTWNDSHLDGQQTNWQPPPLPSPDESEDLIDELVKQLVLVSKPKKRWLGLSGAVFDPDVYEKKRWRLRKIDGSLIDPILYDEAIAAPIRAARPGRRPLKPE